MSYRGNSRDKRERGFRYGGYNRDKRLSGNPRYSSRPRQQPRDHRDQQGRQSKPMPKPNGVMCSPLCPYFRCSKKALLITTEHYRGQPIKEAYCRWIGDKCIGAQCQYAYCALQKMLPDGRCGWALEKMQKTKKEFDEELEGEEFSFRSKSLLSKLGFKEDEF